MRTYNWPISTVLQRQPAPCHSRTSRGDSPVTHRIIRQLITCTDAGDPTLSITGATPSSRPSSGPTASSSPIYPRSPVGLLRSFIADKLRKFSFLGTTGRPRRGRQTAGRAGPSVSEATEVRRGRTAAVDRRSKSLSGALTWSRPFLFDVVAAGDGPPAHSNRNKPVKVSSFGYRQRDRPGPEWVAMSRGCQGRG